jgi:diaminopimelate epimerase
MSTPAAPRRSAPSRLTVAKGHGTHNDFVLIDDREATLDLTPALVRGLADRRGGLGGDGVIRLVPGAAVPDAPDEVTQDPEAVWFMDYRNADGSDAQMCGNGVRVLAAFAERLGVWDGSGELAVGTRAGVRRVRREPDPTGARGTWYAVDMGLWHLPGGAAAAGAGYDALVAVEGGGAPRPGLSVDVGNPHTVLAVDGEAELALVDLGHPPVVTPTQPDGTNVELVVPMGGRPDGAGLLRMRVYERGVGETRSCGTGACAAALAAATWAGPDAPDLWWVQVPGGLLRVRMLDGGRIELAGPAVIVLDAEVDLGALGGV